MPIPKRNPPSLRALVHHLAVSPNTAREMRVKMRELLAKSPLIDPKPSVTAISQIMAQDAVYYPLPTECVVFPLRYYEFQQADLGYQVCFPHYPAWKDRLVFDQVLWRFRLGRIGEISERVREAKRRDLAARAANTP
jgi:hypothetical protein